MVTIRETKAFCPECVKEVDGAVVLEEGKAYLARECSEHGSYRYLLSEHGEDYAGLDQFYMALKGNKPQGRQSLLWLAATVKCQQRCPYCSANVQGNTFDELTWPEILEILDQYPGKKICFSGGEPTLHPHVFDFFREMARRGTPAVLATNGLRLASKEFCQKLKDAGVKEVRVSLESLRKEEVEALGLQDHVEEKLKAIENLGELGIVVNVSPTLFKGLNEEQLYAILEYVKDKPFIREVQATGFAWVGSGVCLPREMMISADEMVDIVYRHYCTCDRKDLFTFAKLVMALTQIIGLRYCLNSQAMIFVRDKRTHRLQPLVEFFHMGRMERLLNWWVRRKPSGRLGSALLFVPVLAGSLRLRTARVVMPLFRLLLANLIRVDIRRYPSELLVLTFNTNCCTPNAETAVRTQCISSILHKVDGEVRNQCVADLFPEMEQEVQESGQRDKQRAASARGAKQPPKTSGAV